MTDTNDEYVYDEATGEWVSAAEAAAKRTIEEIIEVRDSVGNLLTDGDSVTLIKDLAVKGTNQTLLITHHFSRRTREEAVRGDVGSRTAIVAGRV
jgi:uncharacterized Zn ribbon protein